MEQVKKEKNELWEWMKALLIAFGLAAIIRFFLFTPIVVDGESMMPTLENGDRMIVNKIGYTVGKPDRFDIVVFHAPEQKNYIKRVIGLPGDHVEYKDDQLYINGKELEEPYLDQYKVKSLKEHLQMISRWKILLKWIKFQKDMYLLWEIIVDTVKIVDILDLLRSMKLLVIRTSFSGR